jgi:hypothetical protein
MNAKELQLDYFQIAKYSQVRRFSYEHYNFFNIREIQ